MLAPVVVSPRSALHVERTWVWRHFLTASDLPTLDRAARFFGRSPAFIRRALALPIRAGFATITPDGLVQVHDVRRWTVMWATFHHPRVWGTLALRLTPSAIERDLPPSATFAGPSALRWQYGVVLADYPSVWVYADADGWAALQRRFATVRWDWPTRHARRLANLIVWRRDPWLSTDPLPLPQIFVDIWQLSGWWVAPYLAYLTRRLFA